MCDAKTATLALGGHWTGEAGTARCPAHEDKQPSLSLANGQGGRLLLKCHAGCEFADVMDALRERGLAGQRGSREVRLRAHPVPRPERKRKKDMRSIIAKRIWNAAVPIGGTLAEHYLRGRGVTCRLSPNLRYVRDCWHPSGVRLPALVAKVHGAGGFAVHRTYLRRDGLAKADVMPVKAMLGPTKGGAVRLSDWPGRYVVAEGIETALSVLSAYLDGPATVLAALSAGGMEQLTLPDTPGEMVIAPDGDRRGRDAAEVLAHRAKAAGWRVFLFPAPEGADWNEVLCGKAVAQ